MTDNDKEFENFVRNIEFDDTPDPGHRDKLEQDLLRAWVKQPRQQKDSTVTIWGAIMRSRMIKVAAAVLIAIVVLGGVTFWPSSSQNGEWWLRPPAAWGQEIINWLEEVEALVYRGQAVFVGRYGYTHVSGTWSRSYEAKDRSRKDGYYEPTDEDTYGSNSPESVLQHITWEVPDGNDLVLYDVSYEFQCYTTKTIEGGAYEHDPVKRLRFYVNLLDKADRVLETEMFEGKECVGFEISASKFHREWIDRIWLDVETKMPVRIEEHGRPITDRPGETITFIKDQFEYYAEIPVEMFEPEIPEDFINAEPGEIRAAREKEEKGEMIYADVPKELRDEIVAVLKNVKTAVYWEHYEFLRDGNWETGREEQIYLSWKDWRKDVFWGEQLLRTEWFVIGHDDWGQTSFDFNIKDFELTQTIVDFRGRSRKAVKHDSRSHPDNPMDRIIFIASLVNKADRFLEDVELDGVNCYWFEISAKKYGTNPDTSKHRLWIDAETLLPVRTEFEWMQDDGPRIRVREQFEWNPELATDTFVPEIPEGFTLISADDRPHRNEQKSEPLADLPFSVPAGSADIQIEVLQVRGKVSVAQFPSEQNDYELVVAFDDDKGGGPEWYEVIVHVSPLGGWAPFGIYVKAYIDGVSNLVFKDNTVYWHHLKWAAPGRHDGHNYPTYINETEWMPEWKRIKRSQTILERRKK